MSCTRVRITVDHYGIPALGDGHDLVRQHLGRGLELLLAHAAGAADQHDERPVRAQPGAVERGRDLVRADDPDARVWMSPAWSINGAPRCSGTTGAAHGSGPLGAR
jgi:hypothetical protein